MYNCFGLLHFARKTMMMKTLNALIFTVAGVFASASFAMGTDTATTTPAATTNGAAKMEKQEAPKKVQKEVVKENGATIKSTEKTMEEQKTQEEGGDYMDEGSDQEPVTSEPHAN